MGTNQSSLASKSSDNSTDIKQLGKQQTGERGQIVKLSTEHEIVTVQNELVVSFDLDDSNTSTESDDESVDAVSVYDDEDEEDEELMERLRILEDAKQLKALAVAFLHPEAPVVADGACFGRSYFDRYSAPEQESKEEADERAAALEDAKQLKALAAAYLHPETPVVADGACFGRSYFDRYSATEQEDKDIADERAAALEDAKNLKALAVGYLHPETPVVADGACFGRSYFDRYSATEQESAEDANERAAALEDAKNLKALAVGYLHPETPVVADGACFGRSYFDRYSATEQEDKDIADERAAALEDAKNLKALAVGYLHPETPVVADGACFGRSYFDRYSATEQEDKDITDERAAALEDAKQLKALAVGYLHPETPVVADGAYFGRSYFDRYSATEQESVEDANERAAGLEDAKQLKALAVGYLHPETPVVVDGACFGRCYFDRYSAPAVAQDESSPRASSKEVLVKLPQTKKIQPSTVKTLEEAKVTNITRSPSSVLLFGLEDQDSSAF